MQDTSSPRLSLKLQSLSTSSDFLSLHSTSDIGTPLSLQLTPTTPRPTTAPTHVRRKTYAGDLAVATRATIHDYEERIALLESQNSRIFVELNATQNALADEREDRRIERQSLIMPTLSSRSSAQIDFHQGTDEQSELDYERKLRTEILDTLKKIRAQNMTLSQSLRESQENHASLSSVLEAEKREKEELQEEMKELAHKNFTLYEHNKLLVGRDNILQEEISSLMTKSQADDWMRSVLEEELRKQRSNQGSSDDDSYNSHDTHPSPEVSPLAITLEHQGPLRAQLVATRDELHIARRCLEVSESKREELESRVGSLQRNMSQCLDSSAQALEVERELRAEVERYARDLEEEILRLKDDLEQFKNQGEAQKPIAAVDLFSQSSGNVVEVGKTSTDAVALLRPRLPQHIVCGDVQNIAVEVTNVTLSPTATDERVHDSKAQAQKGRVEHPARTRDRESLRIQQLRRSSMKKMPSALSSLALPTIASDPPLVQSMITTPSATSRRTTTSTDGVDTASVSVQYVDSGPSTEERHHTKRESVVLKPLQLGSADKVYKRSHLRPMSGVIPSPIIPPVPPSSPKDNRAVHETRRHRFRIDSADSANRSSSPTSASSTLVGPSSASESTDKEKFSLMVPSLSKKPSFDIGLKTTTTTLILDIRAEREHSLLADPIVSHNGRTQPTSVHMRRASKVLASIAKRTGIGLSEDWLVV
ncbi:hypothetical protein FB446DRAFT_710502 [Lentinula raphanica]|nr:hypothetical protein FB446DRAFT_710502 [Lentinula raphanica]